MKRCLQICLIAVSVLLGVSWTAAGAPPAGEGADAALARRLTDLGIAAQLQQDHSAALAYFELARREVDHPKIQYFQAKSFDALGRYDDALATFQSLKGVEAMVKYRGEIGAYIRAIGAEREQGRLAAALVELQLRCAAQRARPTKPGE